jgi:hypothetical protein
MPTNVSGVKQKQKSKAMLRKDEWSSALMGFLHCSSKLNWFSRLLLDIVSNPTTARGEGGGEEKGA